jgi:hypothetical protein
MLSQDRLLLYGDAVVFKLVLKAEQRCHRARYQRQGAQQQQHHDADAGDGRPARAGERQVRGRCCGRWGNRAAGRARHAYTSLRRWGLFQTEAAPGPVAGGVRRYWLRAVLTSVIRKISRST